MNLRSLCASSGSSATRVIRAASVLLISSLFIVLGARLDVGQIAQDFFDDSLGEDARGAGQEHAFSGKRFLDGDAALLVHGT